MIVVDTNILIYAEDKLNPLHEEARQWWDTQLSGESPICLCWSILTSFIRISTNRHIFKKPLTMNQAIMRVQSWFDQPCVRLINPTESHWHIFQFMLLEGQATANLVVDAHLAALAIEHGCIIYSTDSDFRRFPKLKWRNPLKTKK
ncbi:MAG TPA: type II toxin-antitoxin system VapC family toxin [Acidobacteriota bacterium]|nr:type II toxin-antitoxin system VapC family toxin [Acidobacteriota bacterium]